MIKYIIHQNFIYHADSLGIPMGLPIVEICEGMKFSAEVLIELANEVMG